jgi:hypothetical protein
MENKRLVQILGDMWEELWLFPIDMSDEEIKQAFDRYRDSDYETFEEYIDNENPQLDGERLFVDSEIIVD